MEQQSLNTTAAFDRAGMSASLACAVHCGLLPLALAALTAQRFPTAQQRLDAGLAGRLQWEWSGTSKQVRVRKLFEPMTNL